MRVRNDDGLDGVDMFLVVLAVALAVALLLQGCAHTPPKKPVPPKYDPRTVPVNNA